MKQVPVADLVRDGVLRVEDGNHGEYRPRPDEFVEDGAPFIRAADMSSGVVDFAGAGRINAAARSRIRKGVGAPGDVILSHKGTVGRIAVAPLDSPDYVCSPQTTFWRSLAPDRLDQRFLRYVMHSADFQRQLDVLKGQTDMAPYVSLSDQRSMSIWMPDIAIQHLVGDVLGALDNKIAANEHSIKLLTQLAMAEYSRGSADGELAGVAMLAELLTRGVAPSYVTNGGIVVLNQKCIRDQTVSLGPSRNTAESKRTESRLLMRDDVLVNSTGQGTLGRAARWTRNGRVVVDSHITIVRFDPALVDPACAGVALLQIEGEIEGLAEGSTGQTELRRELLGNLVIRIPRPAIQQRIGAMLRSWDELILAKQSESERLARTRNELLPLLMSGKVSVKHAETIASEVL